jgi:hypothetical protein
LGCAADFDITFIHWFRVIIALFFAFFGVFIGAKADRVGDKCSVDTTVICRNCQRPF